MSTTKGYVNQQDAAVAAAAHSESAAADIVQTVDVLSPTTSVVWATDVDGNAQDTYELVGSILVGDSGLHTFEVRFNGAALSSKVALVGTSTGGTSAENFGMSGSAGEWLNFRVTIHCKGGRPRTWHGTATTVVGPDTWVQTVSGRYNTTTGNITSIAFTQGSGSGSGIDAGSRLTLRKVRN